MLQHMASQKGHDVLLIAALRNSAANPSQCVRKWLGHFPMKQMDLFQNLFQPYDQVPWDEHINLLWSLLMYVEWLALESDFVHSDEVPLHRYVSVGMYWGSSSHPLLPLPVPLARGRWAK